MPKKVHDTYSSDGKHIGWSIFCPACGCGHFFREGIWSFDGNYESPTFSPSMLVNANANLKDSKMLRCHSFVRNGKIEYLSDCSHNMSGKTVDLPDRID